MNDKTLAQLKADHCLMQGLVEKYPHNKSYRHECEKDKRAVQAREREIFCSVKG